MKSAMDHMKTSALDSHKEHENKQIEHVFIVNAALRKSGVDDIDVTLDGDGDVKVHFNKKYNLHEVI